MRSAGVLTEIKFLAIVFRSNSSAFDECTYSINEAINQLVCFSHMQSQNNYGGGGGGLEP